MKKKRGQTSPRTPAELESEKRRRVRFRALDDTLRDGKSEDSVVMTACKAVRFIKTRPEGDYLVDKSKFPTKTLKGLKLASKLGELETLPEGHLNQYYIRHPGAPKYQCVAPFAGVGVDIEAGRRAGFQCKFAAENNSERREKFYHNTGVAPAASNEELFEQGFPWLPVWSFGFECTFVAQCGPRLGVEHPGWSRFCKTVEQLATRRPLSIRIENVPNLLSHDGGKVMEDVLERLKAAGYFCVHGVSNPCDFGEAVDRPRLYILGFLADSIQGLGLEELRIPTQPFKTGECKRRCISDSMIRPRGESYRGSAVAVDSDALHFHAFAEEEFEKNGEIWEIQWKTKFDTKEKRKAIRRGASIELGTSITMGHVHKQGAGLNTRTGFKICSGYGLLPAITSSSRAEGPAKNTCFVFDPLTRDVRTLSTLEVKRLWKCEGLEASIQDLGLTAHPTTTTAVALLQALVLDKIYSRSASCPRLPALCVDGIDDLLSDYGKEELWGTKFGARAIQARRQFLQGQRCFIEPVKLGNRVFKHPWLSLFVWDLRPCHSNNPPERVGRRRAPCQSIDLRRLRRYPDQDDQGIVEESRLIGLPGGSNPVEVSTLRGNGKSWYEEEKTGLESMEKGVARGWWSVHSRVPFVPFHMNTLFMIDQVTKFRTIFNKSAGGEQSLNGQSAEYEMAKLKLVCMNSICQAIAKLQTKVVRMRSWGWNVGLALSWVDFYSAYNQTGIDVREEWQNGAGYVRLDSQGDPEYVYTVTSRSQFGGCQTPLGFCRISKAVSQGCEILMHEAKDYTLQQEWRERLRQCEGKLDLPPLVHRQVTGRCRGWSERATEKLTVPQDGPSWAWNNIREQDELTASRPLRVLSETQSPDQLGDLFSMNTYLDDILNFTIVPLTTERRADGTSRDKADDDEATVGSGEFLRRKYITNTLESCQISVAVDDKSREKYKKGICSQIQVGLGFVFDFSDPARPTVGLRPEKVAEYSRRCLDLKTEMNKGKGKMVSFKSLEGVAHRLNYASQVILRGKIYTGGLFAAMKLSKDHQSAPVTGWLTRNVDWWIRFWEAGPVPALILEVPPALKREDCPFTDASTGWGCGGFWCRDGTCFYFTEEWTESERKLIERTKDEGGVGINFLELATVLFLLDASGSAFDDMSFSFYCDNQVSVELLTSSKSRQARLSILLEKIDTILARHNLNIFFEWLDTKSNLLADCLSRDAVDEFKRELTKLFGVHEFVQVEINRDVRDIGSIVQVALDKPGLLRLQ